MNGRTKAIQEAKNDWGTDSGKLTPEESDRSTDSLE
jgi:hypothetical protein